MIHLNAGVAVYSVSSLFT